MAPRGFKGLWAKASLQYATTVVAGPGKVVACGWLFPVSFLVLILVTFGPPYIGTDFLAYLKTEGNVADKNDAFEAALHPASRAVVWFAHESHRHSMSEGKTGQKGPS